MRWTTLKSNRAMSYSLQFSPLLQINRGSCMRSYSRRMEWTTVKSNMAMSGSSQFPRLLLIHRGSSRRGSPLALFHRRCSCPTRGRKHLRVAAAAAGQGGDGFDVAGQKAKAATMVETKQAEAADRDHCFRRGDRGKHRRTQYGVC
uniref:Uncharacterized protein n=1 Tax=Oryza punctata TaxID=4537 RepID=A0A0E0LKB6_ORYPU